MLGKPPRRKIQTPATHSRSEPTDLHPQLPAAFVQMGSRSPWNSSRCPWAELPCSYEYGPRLRGRAPEKGLFQQISRILNQAASLREGLEPCGYSRPSWHLSPAQFAEALRRSVGRYCCVHVDVQGS